jgi:hypothetical protein
MVIFGGYEFWHTVVPPLIVAVGEDMIEILNIWGVPVHPFALGVTVNTAIPVPEGVKAGIPVTPVPSANPMEAPPVKSKTTFGGVPFRGYGMVIIPVQRVNETGTTTVGIGWTEIVNVFGSPVQLTPSFV